MEKLNNLVLNDILLLKLNKNNKDTKVCISLFNKNNYTFIKFFDLVFTFNDDNKCSNKKDNNYNNEFNYLYGNYYDEKTILLYDNPKYSHILTNEDKPIKLFTDNFDCNYYLLYSINYINKDNCIITLQVYSDKNIDKDYEIKTYKCIEDKYNTLSFDYKSVYNIEDNIFSLNIKIIDSLDIHFILLNNDNSGVMRNSNNSFFINKNKDSIIHAKINIDGIDIKLDMFILIDDKSFYNIYYQCSTILAEVNEDKLNLFESKLLLPME